MLARFFLAADPLANLPRKPLDATRHAQALALPGTCDTMECADHIELVLLLAPQRRPGSGFGTAKFRQIVERSIKLGFDEKITLHVTTAYGPPHLFYLYMGMEPIPRNIYYVRHVYGTMGEAALRELCKLEKWTRNNLRTFSSTDLGQIAYMLQEELGGDKKQITRDDIIKHKELLRGLLDRRLDYTEHQFIPNLLAMLAFDPDNKYPDTSELGCLNMRLSKEGFERWKYVIENNLEFVPFRDLGHLGIRNTTHPRPVERSKTAGL